MKKNQGLTLAELVITSAILAMVFSSVIGASIMLRDVCFASIKAHELQRSVDLIVEYIIRHGPGETSYNGLRSAASLDLSGYATGEGIDFIGLDGVERRYYVQGNSIIYESPTIPSGTRTVYTAAPGVVISLLFSHASMDGQTVSITVGLSQTIRNKAVSGSLVTWVNLMNASQ